jgi:hypothetical protein
MVEWVRSAPIDGETSREIEPSGRDSELGLQPDLDKVVAAMPEGA